MGSSIYTSFAYQLQEFWKVWNIRMFVLLSEFLQIVLYFLIPYRKSTSNSFILMLTNGAYVVSITAASMALAYLSSGMPGPDGYQPPLVLWASFVLLHLAGDGHTIANTLDDYDTWFRRFFNFITDDVILFVVICLQWREVAVPGGWALIAGAAYARSYFQIKYLRMGRSEMRVERLVSGSSSDHAPGPSSSVVLAEAETIKLDEFNQVKKAFEYYRSTRKLIQGLSLTTSERDQSRDDFLKLDPKDAVRIVEIELNLAYDSYFTNGVDPPKNGEGRKLFLFSRLGYRACLLTLFTIVGVQVSLLSGSNLEDRFKRRDKIITRILSFSNVLLNLLALLKFLSSDYVIASWNLKRLAKLPHKRRWWSSDAADHDTTAVRRRNVKFLLSITLSYLASLARVFFRRWSETISRRSFITECFREATMTSSFIPKIFLEWVVTAPTPGLQQYSDEVGEFLFTRLHEKAAACESNDDAQKIFEYKGDEALLLQMAHTPEVIAQLKSLFLAKPYDVRLILWHIATEILYSKWDGNEEAGNPTHDRDRGSQQREDPPIHQCREMSNLISEYMIYLTFECRHIMSRFMGSFMFRFCDISRYIRQQELSESERWHRWGKTPSQRKLQRFYGKIINAAEGNAEMTNQAVLRDAARIAQLLRNSLEVEIMWKVMSDVWVDILVYAATHCDPTAHVKSLAEGGELITIVWLFSAHFGLGEYFWAEEEGENLAV